MLEVPQVPPPAEYSRPQPAEEDFSSALLLESIRQSLIRQVPTLPANLGVALEFTFAVDAERPTALAPASLADEQGLLKINALVSHAPASDNICRHIFMLRQPSTSMLHKFLSSFSQEFMSSRGLADASGSSLFLVESLSSTASYYDACMLLRMQYRAGRHNHLLPHRAGPIPAE